MLQRLIDWWHARKRWKRARQELDRFFRQRHDVLAKTSLRPEHCARTQVLEVLESPRRVVFGIVRHPRPYSFSRQYHEVLEIWCLDVERQQLERIRGTNLSRQDGGDGSPPGWGNAL